MKLINKYLNGGWYSDLLKQYGSEYNAWKKEHSNGTIKEFAVSKGYYKPLNNVLDRSNVPGMMSYTSDINNSSVANYPYEETKKKTINAAVKANKELEKWNKEQARQNSFSFNADRRSEQLRKADEAETKRQEIEAGNSAYNMSYAAAMGLPILSNVLYTPQLAAWLGNTARENMFTGVTSGLGGPAALTGLLGFTGIDNSGYLFGNHDKSTMLYVSEAIENYLDENDIKNSKTKAELATLALPMLLGKPKNIKSKTPKPKTPSIGLDELSTMPKDKKVYSELNPWESPIYWDANTKIYSSRLPKDIYSSNFVKSIYDDGGISISSENYKKAYNTFKKYILKDFGIRLEGEKYTVKDANTLRTEFDKLTDTLKQILADYFNQFQGVISRKFVPYKELAKAYKDGLKYVRDYINSPGFAYRSSLNLNGQFGYFLLYDKSNFIPPVDSKITWIPGHRNANSNLKFGLFNTDRFPFRIGATGTHEGFHWNYFFNTKRRNKPFNLSKNPESPYYNYDYSHIPDEVKNILKPNELMLKERYKLGLGDLKHDAELNEAYSDLGALRYNLEKEGIFDSKKAGEVFTKEHLEKYRKTERGKRDRFILLHTDDLIIDAINVIAENNNENLEYELPMARKGLTLIKRYKL